MPAERHRAWPELRIAVGYNGYAVHSAREAEDAARIEDLRRRGWIVIVVGAEDLARPGRFEAALEEAFRQRGIDVSRRTPGPCTAGATANVACGRGDDP